MEQKILIAKPTWTDSYSTSYAKREGCVAFYKGIPECYQQIAEDEGWVLPYVYTEQYAEQAP